VGATQQREKVATAALILRHAAIRKRTTKTLINAERRTLGLMREAGLEDCRYHNLSGGIVAVHRGYKY